MVQVSHPYMTTRKTLSLFQLKMYLKGLLPEVDVFSKILTSLEMHINGNYEVDMIRRLVS